MDAFRPDLSLARSGVLCGLLLLAGALSGPPPLGAAGGKEPDAAPRPAETLAAGDDRRVAGGERRRTAGARLATETRLPTGARPDPAGRSPAPGNRPPPMAPAPEGAPVVLRLAGGRRRGGGGWGGGGGARGCRAGGTGAIPWPSSTWRAAGWRSACPPAATPTPWRWPPAARCTCPPGEATRWRCSRLLPFPRHP